MRLFASLGQCPCGNGMVTEHSRSMRSSPISTHMVTGTRKESEPETSRNGWLQVVSLSVCVFMVVDVGVEKKMPRRCGHTFSAHGFPRFCYLHSSSRPRSAAFTAAMAGRGVAEPYLYAGGKSVHLIGIIIFEVAVFTDPAVLPVVNGSASAGTFTHIGATVFMI